MNDISARVVDIFNSSAAMACAVLALYAIVVTARRVTRAFADDSYRGDIRPHFAFCVCVLVAGLLEVTAFNYPHYLKHWTDAEVEALPSRAADDGNVPVPDGQNATMSYETDDAYNGQIVASTLVFHDLNQRVTSVYVDALFRDEYIVPVTILYTDEESTRRKAALLYRDDPQSGYIAIHPCGKVSELRIRAEGASPRRLVAVVVNRQIPLRIVSLRILMVACLLFALFLCCHRASRQRLFRYLFEWRVESDNARQSNIYSLTIVALVVFCVFSFYTARNIEKTDPLIAGGLYNKHLVNALTGGHVHLDNAVSDKLSSADRPYDPMWRAENGLGNGTDYFWDWSFYKGKYYCYFGIVPAVVLYVPYHLISGSYLPISSGVMIFSVVSCMAMMLLWREIVFRHIPNMRFAFFLLGGIAFFLSSGIVFALRRPSVYELVTVAALAFSTLGVLLLFQATANDTLDYKKLSCAALSLALAVGCRPTAVFISALFPILAWKHVVGIWRDREVRFRNCLKLCCAVALPYLAIAIPLAWYNYARFGSIFDFGPSYNLTVGNMTAYHLMDPIGKMLKAVTGVTAYFLAPPQITLRFPFFTAAVPTVSFSSILYMEPMVGLISFPVFWALLYFPRIIRGLRKTCRPLWNLMMAMVIIGLALMVLVTMVGGMIGRYLIDFSWLLCIPALVTLYFVCEGGVGAASARNSHCPDIGRLRLKLSYAVCVASVVAAFFISINGDGRFNPMSQSDPAVYNYLSEVFDFVPTH